MSSDEQEHSIEKTVRELELEVASRRNYEKVVAILGATVVAIGALVAWIGFESFSDIEKDVRQQVIQSLKNVDASSQVTLERFEEYDKRMAVLLKSLEDAESRWTESIQPTLKELAGDVPDLKGRYLSLLEGEAIEERTSEPAWRKQATAVILKIVEHLEESQHEDTVSQFSPDDVFNVAQLSRHLSRYDLERRLVVAAHDARPASASARALFLQSESREANPKGDRAFQELMGLVTDLTIDNPHIVLAEAWNAAEGLRQYSSLIDAIDALIERREGDAGVFLPSYAHVIKGTAHLRRGLAGEVDLAIRSFVDAVRLLKLEGTQSQWAESTMREVAEMQRNLRFSGADTTVLDEAVADSGIIQLQLGLQRQLLLQMQPIVVEEGADADLGALLEKWSEEGGR